MQTKMKNMNVLSPAVQVSDLALQKLREGKYNDAEERTVAYLRRKNYNSRNQILR